MKKIGIIGLIALSAVVVSSCNTEVPPVEPVSLEINEDAGDGYKLGDQFTANLIMSDGSIEENVDVKWEFEQEGFEGYNAVIWYEGKVRGFGSTTITAIYMQNTTAELSSESIEITANNLEGSTWICDEPNYTKTLTFSTAPGLTVTYYDKNTSSTDTQSDIYTWKVGDLIVVVNNTSLGIEYFDSDISDGTIYIMNDAYGLEYDVTAE